MSVVRNAKLGSAIVNKFYLGATPLDAVYLGADLIWGGEDDIVNAADVGLVTNATNIIYIEGETFGYQPTAASELFVDNYQAWGGYKTPTFSSSTITVVHFADMPPAFYYPPYSSGITLTSFSQSMPRASLYFVLAGGILIEGHIGTDAFLGWHGVVWEAGKIIPAMYSGPSRGAVQEPDGKFTFRTAGGSLSSYYENGVSKSLEWNDEGKHAALLSAMEAMRGKRLEFTV